MESPEPFHNRSPVPPRRPPAVAADGRYRRRPATTGIGAVARQQSETEQTLASWFDAAQSGDLVRMRNLFDLYNGETLSVDQRQTNTGRTALIIAVQWDRYDVVRWLLDQGADPHYPSPRGTALYIGAIRVQDRHALPVHRRLSENVLELLQAHADSQVRFPGTGSLLYHKGDDANAFAVDLGAASKGAVARGVVR